LLPLPAEAIQQNMVVEPDPIIDAVKNLINSLGIKASKVICAVPGRAVIMKKIQMPRQTDQELEANIEFEANNIIPENLDNINLDYQVLNLVEAGNKMEVLLVAVKKEIVNSYADVIQAAGLSPVVVDVDYFAMENMFEANYPPEPNGGMVGLINIGARYTSVSLVEKGYSTFTDELSIGGEDFTEALSKELNISSQEAEEKKVSSSFGGNSQMELATLLKPTMENLAREIHRTVSLYGTAGTTENEGLRHIYVSGGGAKVSGFCSLLQDRLGIPVTLADPFRGFTISKKVDKEFLAESGARFAVAAGLSIRRPEDK
jgi:type IV pilus assembly protein PilM